MSQHDLIEILKEYPSRWFNAKKLMTMMDINLNSVYRSMARLRICEEIESKIVKRAGRNAIFIRWSG